MVFGKKENKIEEVTSPEIDSLIGEKLKIIGKVEGEGSIRIDGTIEGDIDYRGDITISETGIVNGNVNCFNIYIWGKVEGNVKARNKLALYSTGKLTGDIEISNLIIHDSGFFQGKCTMVKEGEKEEYSELEVNE